MKLDVVQSRTDAPWFEQGLTFTCQQCGNCCTGGPGYVWISDEEIDRLAALLKLQRDAVITKYCRSIGQRYSLNERHTPQGLYDCVFLEELKLPEGGVKRVCSIYAARPLQCRTWPFWDGVLASRENWEAAGKRCHGINHGSRTFTREQIEALRDARDWPEQPPTSAQAASPPEGSRSPKPRPTRTRERSKSSR